MITREADCSFSFPMKIRLHFAEQWGKGAIDFPLAPLGNALFPHCSDYVEPATFVMFDSRQVREQDEATKIINLFPSVINPFWRGPSATFMDGPSSLS